MDGNLNEYVIFDNEDYFVGMQEYDISGYSVLFAHVTFRAFSRRALRELSDEWKMFRDMVSAPIYAFRGTDEGSDRTYAHFMKMLGFSLVRTITCNNGVTRPLYLSIRN